MLKNIFQTGRSGAKALAIKCLEGYPYVFLLIVIGFSIGIPAASAYANNYFYINKLIAVEDKLETKDFLETFSYEKRKTEGTKIGYVKALPKGSTQEIIGGIIRFLLGITGALAFISFTYAGIMFVTAQGDEAHLTKAKKTLFWSILALAIIATSYAIVLGVSQLKF